MTDARPNVDVLANACEFVTDVSDVLSFALTCSALRPVATTRLLSMRPVPLTVGASVRRFHAFLFADAPARAPHIRALAINLESEERPREMADSAKDDSFLIDILAACPNLEHISLVFERRLLGIPKDPHIMDAIAALPGLRSLALYGPSADALNLVRNVRAPLRALGLHQCGADETEFWHPAALEKFLGHLAPTLEKLQLYQFIVDPDVLRALGVTSRPSGSRTAQAQLRSVRSLSVALLVGTPSLSGLQHLFPALDGTLSLGQFIFEDEEQDGAEVQQAYADVRAANQRAQDRLGGGLASADAGSAYAWTKLDRVVCDALFFYLLGLRCPVRLAMLDLTVGHAVAFTQAARHAMDALRANPVPRLKLSLVLNDGLDVFGALFAPELAARLTHLTLCLLYANDRMWSDMTAGYERGSDPLPLRWDDLLGTLRSALQPLRALAYLRLVVHSNAFDDYAPGFSPPAHAQEFLHALCGPAVDCDAAAAAALVRALPSLQYIFLTTSGYLPTGRGTHDSDEGELGTGAGGSSETCAGERRQVAKAWRVAQHSGTQLEEGQPVLVELHDEIAATIIRNEELVLSDSDEAWIHKGDIDNLNRD